MNRKNVFTQDEFVYDVLNNLVHRKEIIVNKKDINRSFSKILSGMKNDLVIKEDQENILITKNPNLNLFVYFR